MVRRELDVAVTVPSPLRELMVCELPSTRVLPAAMVTWADVPIAVALLRFSVIAPPVPARLICVPSTRLLAVVARMTVLAPVPLFWKVMMRGAMA